MNLLLLVPFEALRLALRVMLLTLVAHFVRSAWVAIRRPRQTPPPPPSHWPSVTIQLPIRNEFYVVERAIRTACALDYPDDRLEIQVLDDSNDETRELAKRLVRELAKAGHTIVHMERDEARGYKAGALSHGLARARGELIAIFDADCVPQPDFLRRVVPYFGDPDVGCVQVRWSFLNRGRSLLTRIQALVLDGLFVVDQHARSTSKLPLQFNGTNGVWRRSAIEAAGGWSSDTLAEDADLAFRAYLGGARVVHVRDYAVPTELPESMAAFRTQQRRWARGSAQMLRHLGWRIIKARVSVFSKVMMFMHLGRHTIDPLVLLACVSSPFTTLYDMPFLVDYGSSSNLGVVGLLMAACFAFYGTALRRIGAGMSEILLVPLIIVLAIGLSLTYTTAFVRGLFSTGGVFVRTPKGGIGSEDGERGPLYRASRDPLSLLEIAIAAAHVYFAGRAWQSHYWAYVGFFATVAIAMGWVGIGTLASPVVGHERDNERG